ncbi:flagellin [Ferrovibrio terrae]|uniref:Flagellin n=1 Tax=Ferrovibrio terrae TaxID=2594003 RepID=A0A516GWH8_9PROT|nr:flagellin [Ferrovibrio terrae]QDO95825.1 flagellin [Ferrovibrio terrae]
MANSVNTNVGALIALSSLRAVNKEVDITSKRVQTGYRVADAQDDAAVFAVAQGIRGDIKAKASVQSSLAGGEGLAQVTNAALKGISDVIGDVRAKLALLGSGSISDDQRAIYQADVTQLVDTMTSYTTQANFNGKNLISAAGADASFVADTSGTSLTLTFVDIETEIATFGGLATVGAADPATDFGTANTALTALETQVNNAMASVAAEGRALTLQKSFTDDLVDAAKKGLGALVDADVAAESANLQSLQVRQQLNIQALSIANQQPNTLLSLFR